MLLDADNPPGMPAVWAEMGLPERLALLEPLVPGISTCERIELRGSSARVTNGSEAGQRTHAWIRVSHPDLVETMRARVGVEMVNADLSFNSPRYSRSEPGKVIGYEQRTVIDLSVWTTGRIVFNAMPELGAGMEDYAVIDADIVIVNEGAGELNLSNEAMPSASSLLAYRCRTGVVLSVKTEGGRPGIVSTGQLTMETEIESRGISKTLAEWTANMKPGEKLRCEAPFRDSQSEAAILRICSDGRPIVHDVGNGTTYHLSKPVRQAGDASAQPLFSVVPVGHLAQGVPSAQRFWWDGYIPAGFVTLLGAHGGTGKSLVSLMLAVSIALGHPLFGIATRRGVVAVFSGEDGAELLRHRLQMICERMRVNPAALVGWLHVLDATDGEPALYQEVGTGGRKQGLTTPTYDMLREYIDTHGVDVLIVDNASDTFDASEIDRARVRGFMRELGRIVRARGGAVLLLVHIDKGTARKERLGGEGYSGSTAWHNSARSRLFMTQSVDGTLLIEHEKLNLGPRRQPLALRWPKDGLPELDRPVNGIVQHIADESDLTALLKLIHGHYERKIFVATDTRSRYNAAKVLGHEPSYPKRRKPAEIFKLLDEADRSGLLRREAYRDSNRKAHERWAPTDSGLIRISANAPSAPSAPSTEDGALDHSAQQGAPSAPCGVQGVWGSGARTEAGASGAAGDPDPVVPARLAANEPTSSEDAA